MLQTISSSLLLPDISDAIVKKHSKESLKQARTIAAWISDRDISNRIQTQGITIDSLSSPDLDDGIHIEKLDWKKWWKLFISIASPTEIIEANSPIEQEAFMRATSVYFGESHILHMLPKLIAANVASLNHQTQRLSLTLELVLNEDFEVVKRDLYQSTFYNRQRHSPESFTQAITHTSEAEYEYFSHMHQLARWLRHRRENNDRIDTFDDADRRITYWEKIHWHNNSHISSFVIQEFMLLANSQVAELMHTEWVHGIFRFHMPELEWKSEIPKILDRAEYGSEPAYHKWLWINRYSHFTSPIRRLADYISHRQLICLLEGRPEHYSSQQITDICRHINLQITATLSNQKEELLDMHGKRIVRKTKKNPDNSYTGMMQHIKFRQERWLRTPKSIRDEIIRQIQETEKVEDWMIRTFLLSSEKEIIHGMRDVILADHATRKYINFFKSIDWISFQESQYIENDTMYYRVDSEIEWKSFTHTSELRNNSVSWDGWEIPSKRRKMLVIDEREYTVHAHELTSAKVRALKQSIENVFQVIL